MSIPTTHAGETATALSFQNLSVSFETEFSDVHAVKGLSLEVYPGEVVALVGESGSGKSVTSTAAIGLRALGCRGWPRSGSCRSGGCSAARGCRRWSPSPSGRPGRR